MPVSNKKEKKKKKGKDDANEIASKEVSFLLKRDKRDIPKICLLLGKGESNQWKWGVTESF